MEEFRKLFNNWWSYEKRWLLWLKLRDINRIFDTARYVSALIKSMNIVIENSDCNASRKPSNSGTPVLLSFVVTLRFYVRQPTCCRGNAHRFCNRKSRRYSCYLEIVAALDERLLRRCRFYGRAVPSMHRVHAVWRLYPRDFTALHLAQSATYVGLLISRLSICRLSVRL